MTLRSATSQSTRSARPTARSTASSREQTPEALKSSTARSRSAEPKARDAGEVPSYMKPTESHRSSILASGQGSQAARSVRASLSRSVSPGTKARSPFKSDADGNTVVPRWAASTAASRSRIFDDEEEEEEKKVKPSPRPAPKRRAVSEDPRYRGGAPAGGMKATASRAQFNPDVEEVSIGSGGSPVQSASPSASTASRASPKAPVYLDLSIYVGCEDPAEFSHADDDEDWAARGGPRTNNYFHRPSSVARLGPNADVEEFIAWVEQFPRGWEIVHEIFLKESSNPAGGEHVHRGHQPRSGLTKRRWVKLMMDNQYPNEAGLRTVFDEVAKEINTDKDKKPSLAELRDKPLEVEITLPQLRRFERRLCSVNAVLQPSDKNSPANRFVAWIQSKYTSTLKAWRTMLDLHDTGRVSYSDFLTGCRNMGMGQHGKLVWNNLKKDKVHPLELHELDPKEGENLEEFAQLLWDKTGFDMNKAWVQMDVMNQNYLTLEQFRTASRAFGFWGDFKLLFKGLDSSGVGRLKKEDFKYICKVSRIAHRRFDHCSHAKNGATELVSWCQREMGGPDRLVTLLGFGGRGGHGRMECPVGELVQRLEALRFPGDAREAAEKAAAGGPKVTAASLHKLLTCTHKLPDDSLAGSSVRVRVNKQQQVEHRFGWNSSVDDITAHNRQCCKYFRGYFGWDHFAEQPITKQPYVDQDYFPKHEEVVREFEQTRGRKFETPITDHHPAWATDGSAPARGGGGGGARPARRQQQPSQRSKAELVSKYGAGGARSARVPSMY